MKATRFWTTATLFCLSFGAHFAAPAWAESVPESVTIAQSEEKEEFERAEDYSADALSVEPAPPPAASL